MMRNRTSGEQLIYNIVRHWHAPYEYTVGALAFAANALLMYLALYRSERHLRKYSMILCQSCLVDFYYNIMTVLFCIVSTNRE